MKPIAIVSAILFGLVAYAHDEGHGPKLTDPAKQGGLVAPVVDAKDAKLGEKAALVHKAELVRSEDGGVKLYLYDTQMNPLKLTSVEKSASAVMHKKNTKKLPFTLKLEGDAFVGQVPKAAKKPFNIDITVKEGDRKLLVAFDNLD